MLAFVYKSQRKADTYVYLRKRDGFDVLPDSIQASLGTLDFVLETELTPERKLARGNADEVREALRTRGFHLQFPPSLDDVLSSSAHVDG